MIKAQLPKLTEEQEKDFEIKLNDQLNDPFKAFVASQLMQLNWKFDQLFGAVQNSKLHKPNIVLPKDFK